MTSIETFCGNYPDDFNSSNIKNDEVIVFENDPNFSVIQLWNFKNDTIFVNSFTECEHYVLGGWDKKPEENTEFLLQGVIIIAFMIYAICTVNFTKIKNYFS